MKIKRSLFYFFSISILLWSCTKDSQLDLGENYPGSITELAEWYDKQVVPIREGNGFTTFDKPQWDKTKVVKNDESTLFKTILQQSASFFSELEVSYSNGEHKGLFREYYYHNRKLIMTTTYTLDGNLSKVFFHSEKRKTKNPFLAGIVNATKNEEGDEVIDGGVIEEVDIAPPGGGSGGGGCCFGGGGGNPGGGSSGGGGYPDLNNAQRDELSRLEQQYKGHMSYAERVIFDQMHPSEKY